MNKLDHIQFVNDIINIINELTLAEVKILEEFGEDASYHKPEVDRIRAARISGTKFLKDLTDI